MTSPSPLVQAAWLRAIAATITPAPVEQRRRCQCGEPVVDTDECDRCWMTGELEYERRHQ